MYSREEKKQRNKNALICAALTLTAQKSCFSNIGLREITRHVGLVPATFYYYFPNMESLGLELIDYAVLKSEKILYEFQAEFLLSRTNERLVEIIDHFYHMVEKTPEIWIFLMTEHLKGSTALKQKVDQEFYFLVDTFTQRFHEALPIENWEETEALAELFLKFCTDKAITWVQDSESLTGDDLVQRQAKLKQQTYLQLQMIFKPFLICPKQT